MEVDVRLSLGVDPDESVRRDTRCFDDVELIAHDAALDRVAPDDAIGLLRGPGRRAQDLGLAGGEAIVAGAELDPSSLHACARDLVAELAEHPVVQLVLAGIVGPSRDPGLTIDPGRDDEREPGRSRYGTVDVGSAPHADRAALDDRRDTRGLSARDLRPHERDHCGGIGLGVARLVPRPQVDEDVFVRQEHAKLVGTLRSERRHDASHREQASESAPG